MGLFLIAESVESNGSGIKGCQRRAGDGGCCGAGPRAAEYGRLILQCPDRLKIVALADPSPERRKAMGDAHGVPTENRLASYELLAKRPGLAQSVINTTSDALHYPSSMPLIAACTATCSWKNRSPARKKRCEI